MERTTLTERLHWAETEIAAGRPEQALAHCQELQTAYPRALRVQRVLGEIYLALRRPREALAALDRALAGDPEDVRACCARALVHQMHGDDVSALAWYRRACDLRPDDQSLRATYRDLARRLGEPPYRPSRAGLARLYLRGDLFSHAIREYEQLVIESPDMLDAQVGLAETLWLAGHAQAADERCRRILANAPSCVKAMLIQMALALSDGDMDSARAHVDRTLQLDPDMAIAQGVFADALAAGDQVITAMLRGANGGETAEETMKLSRPTAGFAHSGPIADQRNLSRPLVTSAPVNEPAFGAPQPPSQPLPPPPRPDIPVASQPTEVTRAIKETAFMIWARDDDSQPRIAAQHSATAGDARDGTKGADPTAPPVLRALGGVMDDDEKRQALNWYNWLQSQGAVALGATMASPPASRPHSTTVPIPGVDGPLAPPVGPDMPSVQGVPGVAPDMAHRAEQTTPPATRPPASAASPKLTMPLPPESPLPQEPGAGLEDEEPATAPLPSPEALRSMFAELGDEPPSGTVVEADRVPAGEDAPESADGAFGGGSGGVEVARDTVPLAGEVDADAEGVRTIEALERQFAASGFTPIETRPGLLAEIARERRDQHEQPPENGSAPPTPHSDPTAPAEARDSGDATDHGAPPVPPAASEMVARGPDPRDYPARLAHARQRRDEGQFDEALNEYRAIIKNAPDLLPEVLSDLRASLADQPDHPNLHSVLGDALVSQGDYEAALASFNRATELAQARNGRS